MFYYFFLVNFVNNESYHPDLWQFHWNYSAGLNYSVDRNYSAELENATLMPGNQTITANDDDGASAANRAVGVNTVKIIETIIIIVTAVVAFIISLTWMYAICRQMSKKSNPNVEIPVVHFHSTIE